MEQTPDSSIGRAADSRSEDAGSSPDRVFQLNWYDHVGKERNAWCDDEETARILQNALRGDGRMCTSLPTVQPMDTTTMDEENEP